MYGGYRRGPVKLYLMPVILTILVLVGVYAISITVVTLRHPVNSTTIMYTTLVSWSINETRSLLLKAIAVSPVQDYLHGINLTTFMGIRVINSSELVMGNLTYCYAPVELSLNNALIWLKNSTVCGYTITINIFNTTYYSGVYLVYMRVYRGGVELGSVTYRYVVPALSVRSPQVNAWRVDGAMILTMDAWYYLIVNKPEQLVNASGRQLYPHASLSLWLFMVPKRNCPSYCAINYTS
jgi:hypothetical protein